MLSWLVITPPLVVIAAILFTRRMIFSFIIGICWAAFLARGLTNAALLLMVQRFAASAGISSITSLSSLLNNWNIAIFIFLCSLGILIVLLQKTGAAVAYGSFVRKFVHTARQVEIASMVLSIFFFIDDYFSALTVGSVMRPLARLYGLNPIKLAFLVTAMASPVTILAPISSWIGEIILQLKQAGIHLDQSGILAFDPFYIFVHAIPFIFYAILLISSTWYIVLRGISFGPMTRHETRKEEPVHREKQTGERSWLIDFLFPLMLLISLIFTILLITGGYTLFGGTLSFAHALKQGIIHQALLWSGLITLAISSLFFLAQRKITLVKLQECVYEGSWLMIPSIIMLIHAWTLGAILKLDLQTGDYVAQLLQGVVTLPLFPTICFVTAGLVSWLIGSAWATMGLIFPIVIPMIPALIHDGNSLLIILPVIGSTLSGCIIGSHLSFIADTPIMSAASTGADHLELIKAMAWYIIPVGIATAIAYGVLGYLLIAHPKMTSLFCALMAGLFTAIILLELGQFLFSSHKKYKKY